MTPTVQIDTRQAEAVLREYARWSRRDWADILNNKALDVAFRALPETPKANLAEVQAVVNKEWWPKYIAKRITKGVSFTVKRKGEKIKKGFKGAFTRAQAREVSKRIISARSRSIAFIKSGWLPAIKRLFPLARDRVSRRSAGGAKQYGVAKGSANPAIAGDHPFAQIVNSTIGADRVGVAPLQRAVNGSALDMAAYIARKMEDRARKVAR